MDDRSKFTSHANFDELTYRDQIQPLTDTPESFVAKIKASGRLSLLPYLREQRIIEPHGDILEVGAGSAWLSAELSKIPAVRSVTALDFSEWLVSRVMPPIFEAFRAETRKIERRRGDFHDLSAFGPARFDWVFADSALHHATDVPLVLRQIGCVLKPGGALVALREPVAPVLSWRIRRMRAQTERALQEHGVEEPLYSRREWNAFFASAGLRLEWRDVILSQGLRGIVGRALNGITKADFCLIGRADRNIR
jgi:SAM-dependent methyltransferase